MKKLIFLALLLSSCQYIKSYKPDNIVEEIAEEVIEYATGLEVELSPGQGPEL